MIAETPDLLIQQTFFTRASTDPELVETLGAGVYDHPPEDAQRPYVVIGEDPFFTVPDNTHSGFGWRTTLTLGAWTEQRGFKTGHEIQGRLIALFNHQPMTLPGFHVVVVKHELHRLARDPNPRLRHTQVRFVIETEQDRE